MVAACFAEVPVVKTVGEYLSLKRQGGIVEISKGIYDYFLELLPPRSMGFQSYVMGEGDGDMTEFYREGERFFARVVWAGIPSRNCYVEARLDNAAGAYRVHEVYGNADPQKLAALKAGLYQTLPAIEALARDL